jgi:hypothetical protein
MGIAGIMPSGTKRAAFQVVPSHLHESQAIFFNTSFGPLVAY